MTFPHSAPTNVPHIREMDPVHAADIAKQAQKIREEHKKRINAGKRDLKTV